MLTHERRQELLKDIEIQELVQFYTASAVVTAAEIAANIADANRGFLQVGNMIRDCFGIPKEKEKK